ncbi:MAG TPA: PDR/VanB family oxidoreductase [Burkholderiaceae bacterium]|nr:PDR/VanB family oxidoreductase [Burkholderiaceae bacterium]
MHHTESWTTATVAAVIDRTPTVREFELVPEIGALPYTPGSHIDVRVHLGARQETRSYSLVGLPTEKSLRIAVKRIDDGRGGSRYMHTLQPGARLAIAAPENHFELDLDSPQTLLVAGGIGITPLVSMAQRLGARGADVRMCFCARSEAELAYADELRAALGSGLQTFVSTRGERIDFAAEFGTLVPGAQVYLCGPVPMMEAARGVWTSLGRPPADLRFETFGGSGRFAAQPFRVRVPRHGVDIVVPPEATVLEALEGAGVEVLSDCRRGECGLCALDVLSVDGQLDHRDVFLSTAEKECGKRFCACVSRVAGPGATLVLDSAYRPDGAGA